MTKAKRWPTNAEWARLDGIALAEQGADIVRPLRDRCEEMSSLEIVRRSGQAIDNYQRIAKLLRAVGPNHE